MMTSGGMTAAIDRLERKGFVARVPNPADRRGSLVRLTDAGRESSMKPCTNTRTPSTGWWPHSTSRSRRSSATCCTNCSAPSTPMTSLTGGSIEAGGSGEAGRYG